MYSTLMGGLNARRQDLTADKDKGFTLIELLVVVIIIGILAAIAIPVYLGVQNNAKDSAVKSDVTNAKTAAVSIQTNNGALPNDSVDLTATEWASAGATKSSDTSSLKYKKGTAATGSTTVASFCISAKGSTNSVFFATESGGVQKVGDKDASGTAIVLPATCTTP